MEIFFRSLRSHHFYKILVHQNTLPFPSSFSYIRHLDSRVFCSPALISRSLSSSAVSEAEIDVPGERTETDSEKSGSELNAIGSMIESQNTGKSSKPQNRSDKKKKKKRKYLDSVALKEFEELKKTMRNLERDVEFLKASAIPGTQTGKKIEVRTDQTKSNGLYSLFVKPQVPKTKLAPYKEKLDEAVEMRSSEVAASTVRELSPEMLSFVNRLHEEGYLRNANFLRDGQLDLDGVSSDYFQGFVKSAAERFGQDHQDIAKWLSGSHLKKVALFGCPTVERRSVFAVKSLRTFFSIEEDIVCRACTLKSSCKFVNQRVSKKENVDLADVLKVLTIYASGSLPQQLTVSDDIKVSINKLLKEVANLSQ